MAESSRRKRLKVESDATESAIPEKQDKPSSRKTGNETPEHDGSKLTPRIIVQCGGYYLLEFHVRQEALTDILVNAANTGYAILKNKGTAVDAVEKTVSLLETNGYFNAGFGSLLNEKNQVECDAMIMDGHTLNTGAVMGGKNFVNPISIARKIMDHSDHCAFTGEGALEFAKSKGFDHCEPELLISDDARDYRAKYREMVETVLAGEKRANDSVTAVAMDSQGHFACATSTGGIPGKLTGRIGDAPLVGCGGYANEFGAAGASGHGEALMKITFSREVVYNMEKGQNAQEATDNAVKKLGNRVENGFGSAIAIDVNGNFGKATNAPVMMWAHIVNDKVESGNQKTTNANA